jgi:hypothetical protein
MAKFSSGIIVDYLVDGNTLCQYRCEVIVLVDDATNGNHRYFLQSQMTGEGLAVVESCLWKPKFMRGQEARAMTGYSVLASTIVQIEQYQVFDDQYHYLARYVDSMLSDKGRINVSEDCLRNINWSINGDWHQCTGPFS